MITHHLKQISGSGPKLRKRTSDKKKSIVFHFHRLESNAGLPAVPRNFGLSLATGKYLCFLDCDDYFVPKALERVREHLIMYPELVLSGFDVFVVDEQATNQLTVHSNDSLRIILSHVSTRYPKGLFQKPFKLCATFLSLMLG